MVRIEDGSVEEGTTYLSAKERKPFIVIRRNPGKPNDDFVTNEDLAGVQKRFLDSQDNNEGSQTVRQILLGNGSVLNTSTLYEYRNKDGKLQIERVMEEILSHSSV